MSVYVNGSSMQSFVALYTPTDLWFSYMGICIAMVLLVVPQHGVAGERMYSTGPHGMLWKERREQQPWSSPRIAKVSGIFGPVGQLRSATFEFAVWASRLSPGAFPAAPPGSLSALPTAVYILCLSPWWCSERPSKPFYHSLRQLWPADLTEHNLLRSPLSPPIHDQTFSRCGAGTPPGHYARSC